jgi:hypothetical protein
MDRMWSRGFWATRCNVAQIMRLALRCGNSIVQEESATFGRKWPAGRLEKLGNGSLLKRSARFSHRHLHKILIAIESQLMMAFAETEVRAQLLVSVQCGIRGSVAVLTR